MVTLTQYMAVSVAAAAALMYHAFTTRDQLFPAAVYLTSSKASVALLGNLALCVLLALGRLMKVVFLGTLRETEVERLHDRAKEAVMETFIALTIFREEISFSFFRYFSVLLFVKVFHWLAYDRVNFLETSPVVTRVQHARCASLVATLLLADILFLREAVVEVASQGPNVILLFAFEYVILATDCINIGIKYVLYCIDAWYEGTWSAKGICIFYLELVTKFFQVCVYSTFFGVTFVYYGLPLHLMRDLLWSIRHLRNRLVAFIRYRRITLNMDNNFEDASEEEVAEDATCIICREEMTFGNAKKLPCGHMFHLSCLRSWLERQQTCPMCRTPVVPASQHRGRGGPGQNRGGLEAAERRQQHEQPRETMGASNEQVEREERQEGEGGDHADVGTSVHQSHSDGLRSRLVRQGGGAEDGAEGGSGAGTGGSSSGVEQSDPLERGRASAATPAISPTQARVARAPTPDAARGWEALQHFYASLAANHHREPPPYPPYPAFGAYQFPYASPGAYQGSPTPEPTQSSGGSPYNVGMIPVMPIPTPVPVMHPQHGQATASPEQQAAAAAAAAASAAALFSPYARMYLMPPAPYMAAPPSQLAPGQGAVPTSGAASGSGERPEAPASAESTPSATGARAANAIAAMLEGSSSSMGQQEMLRSQLEVLKASISNIAELATPSHPVTTPGGTPQGLTAGDTSAALRPDSVGMGKAAADSEEDSGASQGEATNEGIAAEGAQPDSAVDDLRQKRMDRFGA